MPKEEATALPPGLDLLWGRRKQGQRGPKPGLSIDAIVEAAVSVGDAEGLDAVSMARVAKELGFTTMSLYRYVVNKDELLQLMWNASAQGAEGLVVEGADWREKLRMWATVQREMMDRHPWITQMPMAAPPLAPNSLTFVERGLETLDETGLAPADKLRVSEARMAHDAARAAQMASKASNSSPPMSFEGILREVLDEATFPRLFQIAWAADIGDDPSGFDERQEFFYGLDRILDGVQVLIDRHKSE
jgi:AcrR family transcriptional regulator